MAALVRAAVGCYDAAKAYRTPFISGKDSLNNQFRYRDPATGREVLIEIPPTLLITGVGIVPDVGKCVTMDLKRTGSLVYLLGDPRDAESASIEPLQQHPRTARILADLIRRGLVLSAHDCSEGGWLVALAEMLIASSDGERGPGVTMRWADPVAEEAAGWVGPALAEMPGRFVVEVDPRHERAIETHPEMSWNLLGVVDDSGCLELPAGAASRESRRVNVADLRQAFLGTLDW